MSTFFSSATRNIGDEIRASSIGNTIIAIEIEYRDEKETWKRCWVRDKSKLIVDEFLKNFLNQNYNPSANGTQHVFGNVWFARGAFLKRDEMAGTVCWCDVFIPAMPTTSY